MNRSPHGDGEAQSGCLPDSDAAQIEAERRAIEAVLDGDPASFRLLVSRYQRRVFGLAMMMTRDRSAAEEITQDAFLKAFGHLERFDRQRPFYPWLASIAVHLAQSWMRTRAARPALLSHTAQDTLPAASDPQALDSLIADEESRRLWSQVERLSSGERTAVLLHYRQQLSVAEIARQLGVAGGTVKTLLFRARRKLRDGLSSPPDNAPRKELR